MCLSDFIYDFYYLSRKKQIILIICAVLVVCLLVGAVCFYVYLSNLVSNAYLEPDIIVSSPDGQYELVIRERRMMGESDGYIYIRKPGQDKWYNSWKEQLIGSTLSDECLPFTNGYYYVKWESERVVLGYYRGYDTSIEDKDDPTTWQGLLIYEFR
jgi:hypothetical protein